MWDDKWIFEKVEMKHKRRYMYSTMNINFNTIVANIYETPELSLEVILNHYNRDNKDWAWYKF